MICGFTLSSKSQPKELFNLNYEYTTHAIIYWSRGVMLGVTSKPAAHLFEILYPMNELCLLTNLSNSDMAAWAQAAVSAIAIVVGAIAVFLQVRQGRMEFSAREARALDSLATLLTHLKDSAIQARSEKRKMERSPTGHPAEPSSRFKELAEAIQRYPLESIHAEVPFEALLNARRATKGIWPLVNPEPELDVNQNLERTFQEYVGLLENQILLLRCEAERLLKGERARHAAAAPKMEDL